MKLYHTPTSPFVRKVLLAAHELGLAHRIETVFLRPSPQAPDPELSRHNPLSKIPALVTDDGETLYDSVVIIDYLESLAATSDSAPRLTPPAPQRWRVLRTQALCDGILDAAILVFYERANRPPELHWQPWLDGQSAKVRQGLDALEADHDLTRDPDATPDLAHLCLGATLGWLDFRRPVGDFREGRPRLSAWFDAFSKRPSMEATRPA